MYDIFFISYKEPNADENYGKLITRFPTAQRIHGVKGIHQAHIAAAQRSFTKMFYVVDGDAVIVDEFAFEHTVHDAELTFVHVWRCKNPVNGLIYGYGGVKLLPKKETIAMDVNRPDMTTSISKNFKAVQKLSNITAFNIDPYNTWRSAFRECAKLSSKNIDRQKDSETLQRLNVWCTVGEDKPFGKYALEGAIAGKKYGKDNKSNLEALKKINDFDWLESRFTQIYG